MSRARGRMVVASFLPYILNSCSALRAFWRERNAAIAGGTCLLNLTQRGGTRRGDIRRGNRPWAGLPRALVEAHRAAEVGLNARRQQGDVAGEEVSRGAADELAGARSVGDPKDVDK